MNCTAFSSLELCIELHSAIKLVDRIAVLGRSDHRIIEYASGRYSRSVPAVASAAGQHCPGSNGGLAVRVGGREPAEQFDRAKFLSATGDRAAKRSRSVNSTVATASRSTRLSGELAARFGHETGLQAEATSEDQEAPRNPQSSGSCAGACRNNPRKKGRKKRRHRRADGGSVFRRQQATGFGAGEARR